MPPSTNPFIDQSRSRIIWHEALKYLNILSYYFENINEGLYGEIPEKLLQGINEMSENTSEGLLYIKNLSILSKLELGTLTLNPTKYTLKETIEDVLRYTKPLYKNKDVSFEIISKSDYEIATDRDYFKIALQNIIFSLLYSYTNQIQFTIEISSEPINLIRVLFNPKGNVKVPNPPHEDPFSKINLFPKNEKNFNRSTLNLYIAFQILSKMGVELKIHTENNLLSYELEVENENINH